VLQAERPAHRIGDLVDEDDIRRCLRDEGSSDDPRTEIIAKLNQRLDEVHSDGDDPTDVGEPSVRQVRSISQHFDARELCAQLRDEHDRDQPRDAVVTALRERLAEVAP